MSGGAALRIGEIRIYPVKGLRGISVPQAFVEPWGLRGDRRWMVVDPAGRFLTQRTWPRMAVIRATLAEDGLCLEAAGRPALDVPAPDGAVPEGALPGGGTVAVTVWDDAVEARPAGPRADAWLTAALGAPCRLVYMADPARDRPVDPDFGAPHDRVSFADGFPLLATSAASLADLNGRLAAPVSMDRFRTNVLVTGSAPWAEDAWRHLRIGGVAFEAVKECARCAVTTVDQETGAKAPDNEPLRTLAAFRRKAGGRIIFGQNLIPRATGRIAIGDAVEVAA